MYFLLKMEIFHCHVSLSEGNCEIFVGSNWSQPDEKLRASQWAFLVHAHGVGTNTAGCPQTNRPDLHRGGSKCRVGRWAKTFWRSAFSENPPTCPYSSGDLGFFPSEKWIYTYWNHMDLFFFFNVGLKANKTTAQMAPPWYPHGTPMVPKFSRRILWPWDGFFKA